MNLGSSKSSSDWLWPFWPVVPLYPYGQRRTLCREVISDRLWIFEQLQGIFYVIVPIRMTVVKLEQGGLLIYAPIAPTKECISLLQEIVHKHGEVKYIILPTISGVEHKVFVGPFARCFPMAQVFVAPKQWSFPVNLPLSWLGLPGKRTQILPNNPENTPFSDEFDYAILGPIDLKLGQFAEVAFFHKPSRTLLVTDSIVSVPEVPPEILTLDPFPLLFHARDNAFEVLKDNEDNRRQGWQRICLFALYLRPSVLDAKIAWGKVFRDAFKAPNPSKKNYFGLFPFQWTQNWQKSFQGLRHKKILVAPILQKLILNRAPETTITWANKLAAWHFQRIIPCHFDAPIETNSEQLRQAFDFFYNQDESKFLPSEDLAFLTIIDRKLVSSKLVPPPKC